MSLADRLRGLFGGGEERDEPESEPVPQEPEDEQDDGDEENVYPLW